MRSSAFIKMQAFFLACMLPTFLFGKGEVVYTRLQSLYSNNAGGWNIEKVVLSDTATVVHFSVSFKPYSWIQMASSTYLSDEKAVEYPVRKAVGLTLDEKFYMPKSGRTEFQLVFAPMPKDTKIFDMIEGEERDMARWFGLHDAKSKVKISVAREEVDTGEIGENMFRTGKAVVRGKIEGYKPGWGYGVMAVTDNTLGSRPENTLSTLIRPDGTFCIEWPLEHPVWDELKPGYGPDIPVYVRPGDTLDLVIKAKGDGIETVEYTSSHPKGCHEKLLKCKMPEVYAEWERKGDIWKTLTDEEFWAMTEETMETGNRLCDYFVWKYGLSPWEAHLLKARQQMAVVINQTVLANWMLSSRYGNFPPNEELRRDFYEGNDYSLYKVLNEMPTDDPSMSFIPYFSAMVSRMKDMQPMTDAWSLASMGDVDWSDVEGLRLMDSLQVEELRGVMGFKEIPYLVQAYLVNKVCDLPDFLTPEGRKEIVEHRAACLTNPYLKGKIWDLASEYAQPLPAVTKLDGKSLEILQPIVDKYKGKYVQMEWMKPGNSGFDFVNNRMVNLIPDFRNHKDLQFVFLFSANTCTKEEFEQFVKAYLPEEDCYWLDFEESSILRAQLRLPNYIKDITLNREGKMLSTPLYTANETQFRRSLRELLEKEE